MPPALVFQYSYKTSASPPDKGIRQTWVTTRS